MPRHFSISLAPILPAWVVVAIAALLALLLVHGSIALLRKRVPARWVTTLAILRAVIVAILVLCLLQPALSFVRDRERLPDLIVLVDTSQSMGIKASADGKTRLDTAIDPLRHGAMLASLRKNFDVHLFAFDRSAYPLDDDDLGALKPVGDSTRFADSLSGALAFQRESESRDAASPAPRLLVSDGDDLGDDDLVATARKLAVPVDTLSLDVPEDNAASPANKITIASVQSPQSVMIGSEAQVIVTLRTDGAVAESPQLSMTEAGKVIADAPVAFRAGEAEQTIRLSYRPAELGVRQYELKLSDAPPTSPPYQFSVRVADDRKQVLILEDNWRWEFKFLRRVLEDDPSFSFTAMLSRGAGAGSSAAHAQFSEADRKVNLAGFPQGRADLAGFDTIVLGDVNPRRWPPALAAALAQAVTDDGKSLVVIAGPRLASLAESPELNALLPVDVTAETASPIDGPIDVRPTREGAASPMLFNLSAGAMPPLDRIYPPLRKRPAATILLEAATRANAYGNVIVMAEHTVGRGRVLFIGTDALWNWQTTGPLDAHGITPYATFWQQTMRALAPIGGARNGDVTLSVQPDRGRYEAGQRATITATMKTDRAPNAGATATSSIQSTLTLPDQKQIPLAFTADPSRPDTYRAEFETTLAGQYKLAASVASPGQPASADTLVAIDVEPARGEMNSTHINEANLIRIAAETGGRHVRASDPSTWPGADAASAPRVIEAHAVEWRGDLSLLVVLCALLGIDWLLRLLRGYV